METQTGTNGKGTGNGIGKGFPRSDKNPTGYTLDDRARRDKPKERESKREATGRKDKDGTPEIMKAGMAKPVTMTRLPAAWPFPSTK